MFAVAAYLDVVLDCFDMLWGLHASHLHKSQVLYELYQQKKLTSKRSSQQKLAALVSYACLAIKLLQLYVKISASIIGIIGQYYFAKYAFITK